MANLKKRVWTRCQAMPASVRTSFQAASVIFRCVLEETLKHEPVAQSAPRTQSDARLLDGAGPFASQIALEASWNNVLANA